MTPWTIERQVGYPLITEVAPSPDGAWVAFAVREPLMTEERSEFLTQLWLLEVATGAAHQITFGDQSNSGAAWSPDSRYLAFISRRGGRGELRALRAGGGESWPLASIAGSDLSQPRWSRDGAQIACLAARPPSEDLERARRARDDAFRWGEQDRNHALYVVPFSVAPRPAPTPTAVTDGSSHVVGHDWLADGSGLAVTAMPSPVAERWAESWLAIVPADGGEPRHLGTLGSWQPAPRVSPDGSQIACIISDGAPRWAISGVVGLFPIAGGEPQLLAATPDSQPVALLGWLPDGSAVLTQEYERLGARALLLPADGGPARPLAGPPMFEVAAAEGPLLVAVGEDFHTPNGIYQIDLAGGACRPLYTPPLPADWPSAPLPEAEVLTWQSPDGMQIEGILTYPLGHTPGQPCPLVLVVHGGPAGCYQRSFLGSPAGYAPIGMLAERGYATLRCNPRGSSGYGREFRFANLGDWGGGDYQDLLAGVGLLVARGVADPERLGIMGWSYGGFMTSWAITRTNRFKAACIGAPVTDPISFNGTADIQSFIPDYFGGDFWEDFEAYRRQSPILHVQHATTPSLIQHGDADLRVPLSQGRQLYEALRRRGIPTELVVYPRQGHAFSEPRMIIDSRNRVVEWLERYLTRS